VTHAHGHEHSHRALQRATLEWVLVLNAAFLVVEIVGGALFHSLALVADAAHMVSDVAALVIALTAQRLLDRPATTRHSYGLQRAEVLAAQASGMLLVAAAVWIIIEAVRRVGAAPDVVGGGLLAVALAGLFVNLFSARLLARARGESLNMHGVYLHMLLDALGSLGAAAAGVAVLVWGAGWVDPAVSIAIAVLVLFGAWGLLRDTTVVLLEGAPRGVDPTAVAAALSTDPEVEGVHHLHIWNLASDVAALSVHVQLVGEVTLHEAQVTGARLKTMLADQFGIDHATVELECHACDGPEPSRDLSATPHHKH
jgi:cobalt-zinc-cadmium efflux system protein